MKKTLSMVLFSAFMTLLASPSLWASGAESKVTPDEALKLLTEGNQRYVAGKSVHPDVSQERRSLTVKEGQHPFATILSCSDSRAPVEILFDQGIADLFVVRVAGNVADVDEVGTIEYGVDHLGTPLMVVLGHTQCGAVTAVTNKAELHGKIPQLVDNIQPAVEKARAAAPGASGDVLVAAAIKENVWQSIEDLLKSSEATRERVKAGKLKVIGAMYDLDKGTVQWLGEHPEQQKLLQVKSN